MSGITPRENPVGMPSWNSTLGLYLRGGNLGDGDIPQNTLQGYEVELGGITTSCKQSRV